MSNGTVQSILAGMASSLDTRRPHSPSLTNSQELHFNLHVTNLAHNRGDISLSPDLDRESSCVSDHQPIISLHPPVTHLQGLIHPNLTMGVIVRPNISVSRVDSKSEIHLAENDLDEVEREAREQ